MVEIIEVKDLRTEEEREKDEIFKFNCVKTILDIIIEGSELGIIGRILNEERNVIFKGEIYKLYESIFNNVSKLEQSGCESYYDYIEHEELNYILTNLGDLDFDRAAEVGIDISNYFSNLLLYYIGLNPFYLYKS